MAAFPSEFLIADAEILDDLATLESDSLSLIYRRRVLPGAQRFSFRLRSIALQNDQLKRVQGKLAAIRLSNDVVTVSIPGYSTSSVTTRTNANARSIGQTTITLTSADGTEDGQFFTFSGHSKVYQVTAVNVGTKEITFYPNLIRAVSLPETLTFNNMVFTGKLRGRTQAFSLSGSKNSAELEIDFVESTG